ncbi:MAG: DUF4339 domain-containing protein, partial [Planctomycetes bacterium]|nr:DUF4339 domain-containing protein [Planctomycetota bacterium]
MKSIEVTCESCGASFVVPASMAGQGVQCACGQELVVPTLEEGEVGIDSEASDVSAISEQEGSSAEGGGDGAATKWHVFIKGEKYGPYSTDKMREMVQEGRLKAHTKAYNKGLSDWTPMGKILTFVAEFEEGDIAAKMGTPVKETMAESTEETGWHFRRDGIAIGPVSLESLQENARSGELIPEQEVSGPETEEWKPAGEVEELQGLFPPAEERTGYYVSVSGERDGPHSENDIREKIEQGELSADSRIWSQSFGEWQKLSEVSQFADALGGSEASEGAVEEIPRSEEQIPQEAEGVAAEKAEEKIEEQPAESAHEEEALSEAVEIETGETEPHEMEEEPVSEYEVGAERGPEEESPVEGPIAEEEPVGFAEEGIPEPDEGVIEEPVEEAFMPEEAGEEPVEEFPHEAGIEPAVEEVVEEEEEVAVGEGREEGEEGPEAEISVAEAEAPEQAEETEETEEPEVATEAEEAGMSDIREQLEGAAGAGVEGAESEVDFP